jgi:hypothetical protein
MITKDGRDTPIEKLTAENYIVPRGEEKDYHAIIEVVQYDQKTGRKLSKPRVQKFSKKIFETHVRESLRQQGYTITILHDPNNWIAEQKEKAAKVAAEQAKAKAKAEQEKFDAAVAAAVAKALVEREAAEKAANADNNAETEQSAKKPGRPAKTE